VTPLSVHLVTGMNLPRITCVTLLLNLTITTPLVQFHSYIDPITPAAFYQYILAAEIALPALPTGYMKLSAPRTDGTLV
jgi:hypothetical protein